MGWLGCHLVILPRRLWLHMGLRMVDLPALLFSLRIRIARRGFDQPVRFERESPVVQKQPNELIYLVLGPTPGRNSGRAHPHIVNVLRRALH